MWPAIAVIFDPPHLAFLHRTAFVFVLGSKDPLGLTPVGTAIYPSRNFPAQRFDFSVIRLAGVGRFPEIDVLLKSQPQFRRRIEQSS